MIPLVKPYIAPKEEMMPAIEQILYSGYIAEGQAVYDFESEFGRYIQNENILALNSGTAALHIALLLLNIGKGDEVISTPMTAEPTNTTIALTGAKIVWADVDSATGLMDPDSVRKKITAKTKAIMVVHYAGMVCDMDKLNEVSARTGVPIIEDAAHALGSNYAGKMVGGNSQFTCFSFQAIKHLTTGDGGMLALRDSRLMEDARKMRWFGLDKKTSRLENDIKVAGYKYGMNNITATIGSIQMIHIEDIIGRHIDNGKYFDEALKGASGINLIPYYPNTEPSYWLYTIKVQDREAFIKMMDANGISASMLHHRNDTHSVFAESRCDLPGMEEWYRSFVHIPCGWWVDGEIRQKIVGAIKKGW